VRLELTTPCLKGRCSNQLSYGPIACVEQVTYYHSTSVIVNDCEEASKKLYVITQSSLLDADEVELFLTSSRDR